jgi:hypothetical protein
MKDKAQNSFGSHPIEQEDVQLVIDNLKRLADKYLSERDKLTEDTFRRGHLNGMFCGLTKARKMIQGIVP